MGLLCGQTFEMNVQFTRYKQQYVYNIYTYILEVIDGKFYTMRSYTLLHNDENKFVTILTTPLTLIPTPLYKNSGYFVFKGPIPLGGNIDFS